MKTHILNSNAFGLSKILGYACGVVLLLSCESKTKEEVAPAAMQSTEVAELTSFLAASTGIKADHIVYEAARKAFVLEKDILITEDDARKRLAAGTNRSAQEEQKRSRYLVSDVYVKNITYFIEEAVPADWRAATQAAFNSWNAVNGTKLFLRASADRTQANLIVSMVKPGGLSNSTVAQASFPTSQGLPGKSIIINPRFNALSPAYKKGVMMHEIGHTIALAHFTGSSSASHIPGTPTSDPKSVMTNGEDVWTEFSAGDIKAVQILYPE